MSLQVSFHRVSRIRVSADGRPLVSRDGQMCWWQSLELFDDQGTCLGQITLHLTRPEVALPTGDQPPYWGVDPRQVGALALLTLDGEWESPF